MATVLMVTADELSQILWNCEASELTPEDDRHIVRSSTGRWIYPDPSAPGGEGWPVRLLKGDETIKVTIEGDSITAIECDEWVRERFGTPRHGLFGAGLARKAARILLDRASD